MRRHILCAASLMAILGAFPAAAQTRPGASLPSVDATEFAPYGFVLKGDPLHGWNRIQKDKNKTIATWLHGGATPATADQMLTLEAGVMQKGGSAADQAQTLAKSWSGTVEASAILLDGDPAYRVTAAPHGAGLQPIAAIVTVHGGYLYLLMQGATGAASTAPLDAVAKAWQWRPVDDPSLHLTPVPSKVTVFNGAATLAFPAAMFAHPDADPATVVDLEMKSLDGHSGLLAYIQRLPMPPGGSFSDLADKFLAQMHEKKTFDGPLAWQARHSDPKRLVTPGAPSAMASEQAHETVYIKWALLQLDPQTLVLINFTLVTADPTARSRYDAAADAIVDSIQPAPSGH